MLSFNKRNVSKIRLDDNTILCIKLTSTGFAKVYFINDAFGEIVDIPAGIVIHCDTNNAILSTESMQFTLTWTDSYNITYNGALILQFNACRDSNPRSNVWLPDPEPLLLSKNLNIGDLSITNKISIAIKENRNIEQKRFFSLDYLHDTCLSNAEIHINKIVENVAFFIQRIELHIGGSLIDRVNGEQLLMFLRLTKRTVSYDFITKKTIIPFNLNLLLDKLPLFKYHDTEIMISLNSLDKVCVSIHADSLYIRGIANKLECRVQCIHNTIIQEEQMINDNIVIIDCHHPLFLLYVCGIDVSKLTKISLLINENKFPSDNELKYTVFEDGIIISRELCDDIYEHKEIQSALERTEVNQRNNIMKLIVETTDVEKYTIRIYGIYYGIAYFDNTDLFLGFHHTYYG